MTAAKFITFEGGEGSGKSTQAERLVARLDRSGIACELTREPGGSPFAETLRDVLLDPATPASDPLAEAMVFYAARADHLARVIRPALAAGRWVVCDRFADSTRVYQCVAGGLSTEICDRLDALVVGATQPDLTFILDVPADVGLARAEARRTPGKDVCQKPASKRSAGAVADRFEARDVQFHETLRDGFLDIVATDAGRARLIDGADDSDVIAAKIWSTLTDELGIAA